MTQGKEARGQDPGLKSVPTGHGNPGLDELPRRRIRLVQEERGSRKKDGHRARPRQGRNPRLRNVKEVVCGSSGKLPGEFCCAHVGKLVRMDFYAKAIIFGGKKNPPRLFQTCKNLGRRIRRKTEPILLWPRWGSSPPKGRRGTVPLEVLKGRRGRP
jgi:hypothetical protein